MYNTISQNNENKDIGLSVAHTVNNIEKALNTVKSILRNLNSLKDTSNKNQRLQLILEDIRHVKFFVINSDIFKPFSNIFEKLLAFFTQFILTPQLLSDEIINFFKKLFEFIDQSFEIIKNNKTEAIKVNKLQDIEESLSKIYESLYSKLKNQADTSKATSVKQASFIKINAERIEEILNIAEELVVLKSQIFEKFLLSHDSALGLKDLFDRTVKELYNKTLSIKMMSLKPLFFKIEKSALDLAQKLNKKVQIQFEGEETEFDRASIDNLTEPLMHLIRNSLDHGIEPEEERIAKGKTPYGNIQIKAYQKSNYAIIEISDDGKGLDKEKIIKKAIEKKLIKNSTEALAIKDEKIYEWLFLSGFTTADKVTSISGRGVGLDVVKSVIQNMNGRVEICSEKDHGTTFKLIFPISTAILDGIIISIANVKYIVPRDAVVAFVNLDNAKLYEYSENHTLLYFREEFIPYQSLNKILNINNDVKSNIAVILENQNYRAAIGIPSILNQTQVVLKRLDESLNKEKCISGAAIMGDGSVALVLNIDEIIHNIKLQQS